MGTATGVHMGVARMAQRTGAQDVAQVPTEAVIAANHLRGVRHKVERVSQGAVRGKQAQMGKHVGNATAARRTDARAT